MARLITRARVPATRIARSLIGLIAALLLVVTALVSVAAPAQASPIGDDYPANLRDAAQDSLTDPWLFYNRECTSFVAWRLNHTNGVAFSNYYGGPRWSDASNWQYAATHGNISIPVNSTPAVGAVAWFAAGHVAWVSDVNGANITVEEYNYARTGTYNSRTIAASSVSAFIHVKDLGGSAVAEGSFVVYAGNVYRIAGGAPIYVSSWDRFGGSQPAQTLSDAQFSALRTYPADGTFVNGLPSGRVFRFAGGAPEYVSTWNSFGGSQPTIPVDDYALDNPDGSVPLNHIRRFPADGTFISNTADGRVYRVAGGAPLYVSTWDHVGGAQATTALDPYEFSNYQHLRSAPADMFLRGLPSGRVFRVVASGHPYYVESWEPYGGAQPFLDVDDWAIDNCDHLACDAFGNLDQVTGGVGVVTVAGWAIDPNARTAATTMHVYVGGPAGGPTSEGFDIGAAVASRPDVAAVFPGTGTTHGFSKRITTSKRGAQTVYVYALNVEGTLGNNMLLGSREVSISAPPTLSASPTPLVSGVVRVGSTLTATAGSWLPAPVTLAYQWLRNGAAISGATKATYVLTSADLGAVMSVRVTGSKTGYVSLSRTSAPTSRVLPALTVSSSPSPLVSGKARVGHTLTVDPGSWQPAPVRLAFQWLRNGAAISGATNATYSLTVADLGRIISVKVTGSRAGYATLAKTSSATGKVSTGTLSAPTPKISGTKKVGRILTAKPGTWKPAGVALSYRWYRSGKKVAGATMVTYRLVKADKGKKLTVRVTGTKPGYTSMTQSSKRTSKVKK